MWNHLYHGWLAVYAVAFLVGAISLLRRPRPSGDAAMGWALGVFYITGLGGVLLVAWLLRNHPTVGFPILIAPLGFLAWPRIHAAWIDTYARTPSREAPATLVLHLTNLTRARVLVRLECWFAAGSSGTSRLYHTLSVDLPQGETVVRTLTPFEAGLLSVKSRFVQVKWSELVDASHNGTVFRREVQPCMHAHEEKPEVFRSGSYAIRVDADGNSDSFRQAVASDKASGLYGNGVF